MSRIFITGSSDGLGLFAAKDLISRGHQVVLHARNEKRASETMQKIPDAENILTADLTSIEETKLLSDKVNALGKFDAIIHNAGVYNSSGKDLLHVNTLAPYILTSLVQKPERLIYLSSGMHLSGTAKLDYFKSNIERISYSDTKLHVVMLCKVLERKWKDVYANTVNPGWVPTKMGGRSAPDSLEKGYETQVWLATSHDKNALVTGQYFFHKKTAAHNPQAYDVSSQNKLLDICAELTGVTLQ